MGRKAKDKNTLEYICPKCKTKIAVEKGNECHRYIVRTV